MANVRIKAFDGLRGVLFLIIFFYHQDITEHHVLAYSVDMFFVLSGFLIFYSVKNDLVGHHHDFLPVLKFIMRRFFRIFGPYYFVVLFFYWYEYIHNPTSILAFLYNFELFERSLIPGKYIFELDWAKSGSHLWSVSLEMQFYLMAALIMVVSRFLKIRNLLLVLLALSFASLFYYIQINSDSLYGLNPITSMFFFLFGGLAFDFSLNKTKIPHYSFGLISFVLLVMFYVFRNESVDFMDHLRPRGTEVLLGLSFAFLVFYLHGDSSSLASRILNFKPLRYLGMMSYSLYLCHLFSWDLFNEYKDGFPLILSNFWGRFLLTMAMGTIVWFCVESPCNKIGKRLFFQRASEQ